MPVAKPALHMPAPAAAPPAVAPPVAVPVADTGAALMERLMAIPTQEAMIAVMDELTEEQHASLPDCPICKKFYPNKQLNAKTLAAIEETEEGDEKRYNSMAEMLADLNSD